MNEQTLQKLREQLEHQSFIAEIDRRKNIFRALLIDYEYKLRSYLEKQPRTEQDYQGYLIALEERNEVLAMLARLSSCTFATPSAPTSFEEFKAMEYVNFDYTKEFIYDE